MPILQSCILCSWFCTDWGRLLGAHIPYLLKCGHHICEPCARDKLRAKKPLQCMECLMVSPVPEGQTQVKAILALDFHMLGFLCTRLRLKNTDPSVSFVPAGLIGNPLSKETNPKSVSSHPIDGVCSECSQEIGSWLCIRCSEVFCGPCFDQIHKKSKTLMKHVPEPLKGCGSISKFCPQHEDRLVEFYCEDDGEVVCSYCAVLGQHKDHNNIDIQKKQEEKDIQIHFNLNHLQSFTQGMATPVIFKVISTC
ncbi:unnamed protein product [Darwinula stevensoni]|uniref:B box-type domain-containing protein n=1 Tax=Darwinula stevensoni TaxID=69355 RepID=A0A7R8X3H0_9CRUS|nr:unnamed protein product [Darwinula stevensoni]CAG0884373.1 unnamed protein product [Darwinula stevensoni]